MLTKRHTVIVSHLGVNCHLSKDSDSSYCVNLRIFTLITDVVNYDVYLFKCKSTAGNENKMCLFSNIEYKPEKMT